MGFGTGTAWYKNDRDGPFIPELVNITKSAIKHGYQLLGGSKTYSTEEELGRAIAESGVPREQLNTITNVSETIEDIPKAHR